MTTSFDPAAAASDKTAEWVADMYKRCPPTITDSGNVRTGPVRLSFCENLMKPRERPGKDPQYQCSFLFPAGADMSVLKAAAQAVAVENWPNAGKPGGPTLFSPFHDQGEKAQYEGYAAGSFFLSCSAQRQPPVVDARNVPIVDKSLIYPGAWALAVLRPFKFEYRETAGGPVMKRGVSFGLQMVMRIADDKQLGGGGGDPAAEFAGVNIDVGRVDPASLF